MQYVLRKMREWDLKNSPQVSHFIMIQNMLPNALKVFTSERQVISASDTPLYTSRIEKDYFFSASKNGFV
jgi:hypothetical protein